MRIMKITISHPTEGQFSAEFEKTTHIHSAKNAQGKTSLIRFLIYGLGCNIPITDKIKPAKYKVELWVKNKNSDYYIIRNGKNIICDIDGKKHFLKVDSKNTSILKFLLDIENENLLTNILGLIYTDQEHGWNRFITGIAAGKISTNLNQILYGLSDSNDIPFKNISRINSTISFNKAVLSLEKSRQMLDPITANFGNNAIKESKKVQSSIVDCQALKKRYEREIDFELNKERNNRQFYQKLDDLNLYVRVGEQTVKVCKENIVGSTLNREFNTAKIEDLKIKIAGLDKEISRLNALLIEINSNEDYYVDLSLQGYKPSFDVNKSISQANIGILETKRGLIESSIKEVIRNSGVIDEINQLLLKYCIFLKIQDKLPLSGVECNSFDKMSGTDKQKLILAYRLSVLKYLSEKWGVNLPIIIDSVNRETDSDNMRLIFDFLNNYFSDHQVIISSIEIVPNIEKCLEITRPLLK